jgi:Tetratricopeptide repeat
VRRGLAVGFLLFATSRAALADEGDAVAAFREARALVTADRCDEAVPKLRAIVATTPLVGAWLNLGECYERTGKLASALDAFRSAEQAATDERRAEAHKRADGLASRVGRLTIAVASAVDGPDLTLTKNGVTLPAADRNVAVAVDAGSYTIAARAPDHRPFEKIVTVADGEQRTLVVELETIPNATPVGSAAPLPIEPPPPDEPPPPRGSALRTVGWVGVGMGAAGLAAGGVLGVLAIVKHGDLTATCPAYPQCPASAESQANDLDHAGNTAATGSTIAFIAGAALGASGLAILLLTPARATVRASVSPFGVRGTF